MKRLLLAVALLCSPACAQSFVQSAVGNSTSTATAVTVNITTTANHAIAVGCRNGSSATATAAITDSAGQTGWVQTASGYESQGGTGNNRLGVFVRPNSAALTSITCTWNPTLSTTVAMTVGELSNMAISSLEDSSVNANNSNGTTASSGSLTTTNANDILLFFVTLGGGTSGLTAGSNYTLPANSYGTNTAMTYKIVSSTQSAVTTSDTWTTNATSGNVFTALKGASAAAPPGSKRRKLERLGAGK